MNLVPGMFFREIFGSAKGYVCLALLTGRSTKKKFQETFYQYPDQLKEMHEYVEQHKYAGDIYFCPQLLRDPQRIKDNVVLATCIWADLDTCAPSNLLVPASIVLETSPHRYQGFWVLDEPIEPTLAEDIARRIAYHHAEQGADRSGWDLTQLLRVPETFNFKYGEGSLAASVTTSDRTETKWRTSDFSDYPEATGYEYASEPLPALLYEDGISILERYSTKINGAAFTLFHQEADEGKRSESLFRLEMLCAESGMAREDAFQVARDSICNKWRDQPELLWRDICRAYGVNADNTEISRVATQTGPELVSDQERRDIEADPSFVERYVDWAKTLGDAAVQYHQASAFIALSSLLSSAVVLPTSFGSIIPNVWVMLLAGTTITRKAQPLDAKVLTPSGWKQMGDLKVGDYVIGQNGKPTRVIGISPRSIEDVYRVTFNDGASTECTDDHLWTVHGPGGNQRTTMSLSRIRKYQLQSVNGIWLRQIPRPDPVQFEAKQRLPVEPYLMGLILGDGSSASRKGTVSLTSVDEECLVEVRRILDKHNLDLIRIGKTACDYRIKSRTDYLYTNYVLSGLRQYGLEGKRGWEKWIPYDYLRASVEDRIELLRGLMDTDGWTRNNSTGFASASKQLALDMQELVRSLGGWSNYDGGHPTYYMDAEGKRVECRISHLVSVSMPLGINPFRLSRKAERLSKRAWARPRSMRSIKFVGQKEVQCITVNASDGLYVTDDYVTTHNSTSMNIVMDLLEEVDETLMMATDGSIEGFAQALSERAGRVSIFFRDEFTGLLESMSKKDYMAGMPEFFTGLYDGRSQIRRLRKEEVKIKDPRLIIFAGGIKSRMQQLVTFEHVSSGFLPRFIFVTAQTDPSKVKPLGPPTEQDWGARDVIKSEMSRLSHRYRSTAPVVHDGKVVGVTEQKIEATLTKDAWRRFNQIDQTLMQVGMDSGDLRDILTPLYARLGFSMLKAAVLIAAARTVDTDTITVEEGDIARAAYYGERWRYYAQDIVVNIGKGPMEHKIELVSRAVAQRGRVGRSALMNTYHLTANEMNMIARTLEERGLVNITNRGSKQIFQSMLTDDEKKLAGIK